MVYGQIRLKAVGHGSGDLEGLQFKSEVWSIDEETLAIEGRILNPKGD